MKSPFKVGEEVRCKNAEPLSESGVGPPLIKDKVYTVLEVMEGFGGHEHLDVGLKSEVGSISCLETGVTLPRCTEIHWCHPSRFEKP